MFPLKRATDFLYRKSKLLELGFFHVHILLNLHSTTYYQARKNNCSMHCGAVTGKGAKPENNMATWESDTIRAKQGLDHGTPTFKVPTISLHNFPPLHTPTRAWEPWAAKDKPRDILTASAGPEREMWNRGCIPINPSTGLAHTEVIMWGFCTQLKQTWLCICASYCTTFIATYCPNLSHQK